MDGLRRFSLTEHARELKGFRLERIKADAVKPTVSDHQTGQRPLRGSACVIEELQGVNS